VKGVSHGLPSTAVLRGAPVARRSHECAAHRDPVSCTPDMKCDVAASVKILVQSSVMKVDETDRQQPAEARTGRLSIATPAIAD